MSISMGSSTRGIYMSFVLPNGPSVEHVNVGETRALYREIF